jgi:hypothetical protein
MSTKERVVLSYATITCYAGFNQFEPGMDIDVDLSEVWGMAEWLRVEEGS